MSYIIGIDLGTTNTALFYANRDEPNQPLRQFRVPQAAHDGVEEKDSLPSLVYLVQGHEVKGHSLVLPWDGPSHYVVGSMAEQLGKQIPTRLIHSAKSWLGLPHSRARDAILPSCGDPAVSKISAMESVRRILDHLRNAWNHKFKQHPMEKQSVILTVPASFDDRARRIVKESSEKAGLKNITFLEEPQAAFYHAIQMDECPSFNGGDMTLVVDIGGGTTDFSLIRFETLGERGQFQRVAVSDHLLIGGDNIDRAIAYRLKERLDLCGSGLGEDDWLSLIREAKAAKEELLSHEARREKEIVLFGKSSSLLGGVKKVTLQADDLAEIYSEFFQFFPWEEASRPLKASRGMQTYGLPYEAEPNVLRHLAKFLLPYVGRGEKITHVLFNGGQVKARPVTDAVIDALNRWFPHSGIVTIPATDPDLAVAKGALLYGLAFHGIRGEVIKGGSPRTFFLEVESEKDADRLAVLILPEGTERGAACRLKIPFLLKTNQPVRFNLYSIMGKMFKGQPGDIHPIDNEMFRLQGELHTIVKAQGVDEVSVQLEGRISEIGLLELTALAAAGGRRFSFEFSLKNSGEEARKPESVPTLSDETISDLRAILKNAFKDGKSLSGLFPALEKTASLKREQFSLILLRHLFDELIDSCEPMKSHSDERASRFWNCLGFFLRPGMGHPLDKERIQKVWKIILKDGLNKFQKGDAELQFWIALRRIASGMNKGQQLHLQKALFQRIGADGERPLTPKGRQEQYLIEELVRTLASFELIEIKDKVRLGNTLLKTIQNGSVKEGFVWSLGRVGARVPLYASASSQVPKRQAETWLESLLKIPAPLTTEWKILLLQISRKTVAEHLDISPSLRERVRGLLKGDGELLALLDGNAPASAPLEESLLGDSIPLGLKLIPSDS